METCKTVKCQCPDDAIDSGLLSDSCWEPQELKAKTHKANECPGDYEVKLYVRGEKKLYLCSCCTLLGDKEAT